MGSRIVIDNSAIQKIADDAQIKDQMLLVTMAARDIAKAIAPEDTGDYKNSIEVATVKGKVRLKATDFKSHWIEWGTANGYPAHAPLRRAFISLGFRIRGGKKSG